MPPAQSKPRHNILRLTALCLLLAGSIWIIFNRQFVIDHLTVWRYTPSTEIAAIATRAQMSRQGVFYLYASSPQLDERSAFNTHCKQLIEKTAILGCYVDRRIYVFDVTDSRLDGIREVTAAHEMLHAAYDRLADSERSRVNRLIEAQAKNIQDQKLKERLALYDKTEPGERLNELHSILGTEIESLAPELESYYGRYFTDRAQLVALSNRYETVFRQIEDQQQTLISQLNALADQIDAMSKAYETALAALKADITRFNLRAESGAFTSQNQFVAERNQLLARQTSLQSQRNTVNAMIADYTEKQSALDALNSTAEGLQRSINSTLPEAPSL